MKLKERLIYIGIIIILLLTLIKCNNRDIQYIEVPIVIKVPEIKGEFTLDKPKEIKKDSIVYKYRDRIITTPNPLNEELLKEYELAVKERDSLKQEQLFFNSIEIRDYNSKFEDEYLSLEIMSKTQGKLLEISSSYTIKERAIKEDIKVPIPNKVSFYIGGKINLPTDLNINNSINLEGLGGIKLKNDNIILGSYNTDKQVGIGYMFNF